MTTKAKLTPEQRKRIKANRAAKRVRRMGLTGDEWMTVARAFRAYDKQLRQDAKDDPSQRAALTFAGVNAEAVEKKVTEFLAANYMDMFVK